MPSRIPSRDTEKTKAELLREIQRLRKSLDARVKDAFHFVYTTEIRVQEGQTVAVGTELAMIDTGDGAGTGDGAPQQAAADAAAGASAAPEPSGAPAASVVETSPVEESSAPAQEMPSGSISAAISRSFPGLWVAMTSRSPIGLTVPWLSAGR